MGFSIIHYYGQGISKCGYCKGVKCSNSHGMHAYTMLPQDYQDLIDRGWRRSGNYCYKPTNSSTCCPCYTIKCDALEFKLTKSHKKILKRMQRFLKDGKKDKSEETQSTSNNQAKPSDDDASDGMDAGASVEPQAPDLTLPEVNIMDEIKPSAELQRSDNEKNASNITCQPNESSANKDSAAKATLQPTKTSMDNTKPPRKKAKQMRLERREAKLAAKGACSNNQIESSGCSRKNAHNQEKSLADYFVQTSDGDKHQLKLVLVPSKSEQFTKSLKSSYALYEKYQTVIHHDKPSKVEDYLEFLQKSPLKHSKPADGPVDGYGSFHQQYWLDDVLIAVGVIDILPNCVSSVYFFYDPDYSFLSLGTYASLREIHFVQQLAEKVSSLKNYYMGFYIHSCPKMRYKGKLVPSYLLCPETYTWHLLTDEIRAKLDAHKYQRLNENANAMDANEFTTNHLDAVLLLINNSTYSTYREYIQSSHIAALDNMLDAIRSRYRQITGEDDDREMILEYGHLVGKNCAHRMLYTHIK